MICGLFDKLPYVFSNGVRDITQPGVFSYCLSSPITVHMKICARPLKLYINRAVLVYLSIIPLPKAPVIIRKGVCPAHIKIVKLHPDLSSILHFVHVFILLCTHRGGHVGFRDQYGGCYVPSNGVSSSL